MAKANSIGTAIQTLMSQGPARTRTRAVRCGVQEGDGYGLAAQQRRAEGEAREAVRSHRAGGHRPYTDQGFGTAPVMSSTLTLHVIRSASANRPQGEAGLADTPNTRHGRQPPGGKRGDEGCRLGLAADEARRRLRKVGDQHRILNRAVPPVHGSEATRLGVLRRPRLRSLTPPLLP
ncbi:hypothetical protein ACFXDJ_03770 [Streptomyces sp. NPDC059443]|uniref:hypothetical protein n=1 Tax=unclassified Streptomyces TaxID=2593676 RepID=UPI0036BF583C